MNLLYNICTAEPNCTISDQGQCSRVDGKHAGAAAQNCSQAPSQVCTDPARASPPPITEIGNTRLCPSGRCRYDTREGATLATCSEWYGLLRATEQ